MTVCTFERSHTMIELCSRSVYIYIYFPSNKKKTNSSRVSSKNRKCNKAITSSKEVIHF